MECAFPRRQVCFHLQMIHMKRVLPLLLVLLVAFATMAEAQGKKKKKWKRGLSKIT